MNAAPLPFDHGAPSPIRRLVETRAWLEMEAVLGRMLSDYLGTPFVAIAGAAVPPDGSRGSSIALTRAGEEVGVELALFAEATSARAIAAAFCRCESADVDDETSLDVLLELANSGMGAMRAAFLSESLGLAGALPRLATVSDATRLLTGVEARVLAFRSATATVHVVIGALTPANDDATPDSTKTTISRAREAS